MPASTEVRIDSTEIRIDTDAPIRIDMDLTATASAVRSPIMSRSIATAPQGGYWRGRRS